MSNRPWPPYKSLSVPLEHLPHSWTDEINSLLDRCGVISELRGDGPTGREAPDATAMHIAVVAGGEIKQALPWLWELYADLFKAFASAAAGRPLYVANDIRSSININCLRGVGDRYEKHVDSNPMTGLLFATEQSVADGGELVFQHPDTQELTIVRPRIGMFICFDAREITHWVAPLKTNRPRVSIPMNYYWSPTDQTRPAGLDRKLYG